MVADRFGNLVSTQYGGSKCRCLMCGRKDAGSNRNRNSYLMVNIVKDEDGWLCGAASKKHSHKIRRVREKRIWQAELLDELVD